MENIELPDYEEGCQAVFIYMHNIFIIAAVYDEVSKFSVITGFLLLLVNYVGYLKSMTG